MYETLDFKTREHVGIREGQKWFRPNELGRECDLFYSSRGKSLNETNHPRVDNTENKRFSFGENYSKRTQFNSKEPVRTYQNNRTERICFVCGDRGTNFHLARSPKRVEKPENSQTNKASGLKINSENTAKNQLDYIDLFIDGKKNKMFERFRK